ncbi:phosphatase PAP2 family protein [Tropicibacter sp. R16_0]|uniref:phosphatase PAP2 family protein n=1 Tax=Tropicibacter sp. R16_0 TaxID=2821102 RepID=UPI001ADBB955|nr:phosphatase PAP2 family protein [Tropicibacter sp. R16_0]MBO9450071.1 phosphatase PAP2 family protein [Tropicibacter sp. R16_0]
MSPLNTRVLRQLTWCAALILLVGATLYPSDMEGHYAVSRNGQDNALVTGVEDYGRHLNTLIPIGVAIALRDVKGLWQIGAVVLAGTVATHGPKRLLNDVEILGTRLGQRPHGGDHNLPSGHSALASAGAYIAVRRYSKWFGVVVWPILLLTMYARYMLDAHTVSATIAGAVTGMLVASVFIRPCFRLRRILVDRKRRLPPRTESGQAALV